MFARIFISSIWFYKVERDTMDRKYYIDNLKWVCILMLLPFHSAVAFNNWGEAHYIWFCENSILSLFVMLIVPWYMPLLMVLAGMNAKRSLDKRGIKGFVAERLKKLFLPLLTGTIVIAAALSYIADKFHNGYNGSFFSHYNVFFGRVTDLTGFDGGLTPAHLWFLLYLFIISMFCLLPVSIQRKYFPGFSCRNIHIVFVVFMGLIPMSVNWILNFGGKSVVAYLVFFLLGYYIISEDVVISKIVKCRLFLFILWLVTDIINVVIYMYVENINGILLILIYYSASWSGILAITGFASDKFCQCNKITKYFTSRSFGIYIFHMLWVVLVQFYLYNITENVQALFIVPSIAGFMLTIATVEVIGRIPALRILFAQYFIKK